VTLQITASVSFFCLRLLLWQAFSLDDLLKPGGIDGVHLRILHIRRPEIDTLQVRTLEPGVAELGADAYGVAEIRSPEIRPLAIRLGKIGIGQVSRAKIRISQVRSTSDSRMYILSLLSVCRDVPPADEFFIHLTAYRLARFKEVPR
jgi:hypothetical protein